MQLAAKNLLEQQKDLTVGTFTEGVSTASSPPLSSLFCQLPHRSKINPHLVQIRVALHMVAPPGTALHMTPGLYFQAAQHSIQKGQYQSMERNPAWFWELLHEWRKSSPSLWAGGEQKHPKVTVRQQGSHKTEAPLRVQFASPVVVNLGLSFQQPLESGWDGLWASGLLFC